MDKCYITFIDEKIYETENICKIQGSIIKRLKDYFDVYDLREINNIDLNKYDKILIDGNIFNILSTKISMEETLRCLEKIRNKNNYVILHDLHDWSFGFKKMPMMEDGDYGEDGKCKPNLTITEAKRNFRGVIKEYKLRNLIFIYECPEATFLSEYLKDEIKTVNYLYHFIDATIYYPRDVVKNIDILFYGADLDIIYPFRNRIYNVLKYKFNIVKIPRIYDKYVSEYFDEGLAKYISRSWLCIACTSVYSYALMKYREISECGSVVLGNVNEQIERELGGNYIELNETMNNEEIINKTEYYLNNKELLIEISKKCKKHIKKYNDKNYICDLLKIINV